MIECPECHGKYQAGVEQHWKDGVCFHCHEPLKRVNRMMFDAPNNPLLTQDHGWIQWKGTNVCMDVHCQACEDTFQWFGHVDGDFTYFIRCACSTVYAVDGTVRLIALTPEEALSVADSPSLVKLEYGDDDDAYPNA